MINKTTKNVRRTGRQLRVRKKVAGTAERPRLNISEVQTTFMHKSLMIQMAQL